MQHDADSVLTAPTLCAKHSDEMQGQWEGSAHANLIPRNLLACCTL